MGIRTASTKDDLSLPVFSDDILKVEISGPNVRVLGFQSGFILTLALLP